MKKRLKPALCLAALLLSSQAFAAEIVFEMQLVDGNGNIKNIGTITATDNQYGTLFTPRLSELSPGIHGFHIHTNPDCSPKEQDGKKVPAAAAGGHFDPANTGKHEGPWSDAGHLGDLPALFVTADGKANYATLAPRVKLADLVGRSLMIHAGGDNHSDAPAPLGGGGARLACGIAK